MFHIAYLVKGIKEGEILIIVTIERFLHNSMDHNGVCIIIDSGLSSFVKLFLALCCKTKLNYYFMYISVLFDDTKL